jgi:catechol 2,3-dioxygenase-like lactoylglutathione lyase family enzyme
MQLRVARHTERLDEVVAFYRDGIGLTEIGGFRDHDGYDGTFLAVRAVSARLGVDPIPPANPYWAEHGVTFQDPDGFRVVLVPERWEC